jgi:hypothetical protein
MRAGHAVVQAVVQQAVGHQPRRARQGHAVGTGGGATSASAVGTGGGTGGGAAGGGAPTSAGAVGGIGGDSGWLGCVTVVGAVAVPGLCIGKGRGVRAVMTGCVPDDARALRATASAAWAVVNDSAANSWAVWACTNSAASWMHARPTSIARASATT